MCSPKSFFFLERKSALALVKKIYTGSRSLIELANVLPDFVLLSGLHLQGNVHPAIAIFYFYPNFQVTKFETTDHYFTYKENFQQTKWMAQYSAYLKHGHLRLPSVSSTTWNLRIGNFTYSKEQSNKITINP